MSRVPSQAAAPPGLDDDQALVAALRSGDPRAPATLWDRYARLVRRVIQRALGPASPDVEDLVQESFLRLVRALRALREPGALRAFVLTVTSSVITSELRRRKVRRFLSLTRTGELPEIAAHPRDDDSRELLVRVYTTLDRAPAQERMAFVLVHLEGTAPAAAAEALGMSLSTLKRRLARVEARLDRLARSDPGLAELLGLRVSAEGVDA